VGDLKAFVNRVSKSAKRRMYKPMMRLAVDSRTFRRMTKYGYFGVNGLDHKI